MTRKELLLKAKTEYPQGTKYLSATNQMKQHQFVSGRLRWAENYDMIVCDSFGAIYFEGNWAKIIK